MDKRRLGRIKLIFTKIVDRFLYQLTYSIIQQLGQWWLVRGIRIPLNLSIDYNGLPFVPLFTSVSPGGMKVNCCEKWLQFHA